LKLMEANIRGTDIRVLKRDLGKPGAAAFPGQAVIFVDPPYETSPALWGVLAPALAACLLPEGVLVWETDSRTELAGAEGLVFREARTYGAARFHFFRTSER
jgi:16S rRNA G966 N2-methylase RsmD